MLYLLFTYGLRISGLVILLMICVCIKGSVTMRKIIKNSIQCKLCGDVIESKHRHDLVKCKCGACAVDGGHDYLRRCCKDKDDVIELSITEQDEE